MNNYSDQKYITAAGFIIFRIKNNNPEILGLKAVPKFRKQAGGIYDVPKGRIDPGETPIEAAHRELFEEAGLKVRRIISKTPIINVPLALWVAEVDDTDDVNIVRNQATGLFEHEGYKWMKIDEMKNTCLKYLRPVIIEAKSIIWDYTRI
jgi:8-oxo-dGTP pyrophosphatase MutT (NUDIX family)|tara:strand:- start:1549 stop:1998 length:450 start_codon:yes stop_codon:yes gene_type:complete